MTIIYRDVIGYVVVKPDGEITFSDGFAFFDVSENEYKISTSDIYMITKD